MLKNSKEKMGCEAKQEGIMMNSDGKYNFPKGQTSSRQWSGFRNPRIVRVSRSFGGKDRHSKVCTIRGLRDRRIRLSVPTAIQLYDLQDKLKLGQPSKVIDWLLDVTKLDIDKLPPLPIPTGFSPFHEHMLFRPPHQYDDHDHHNSTTSSSSQFPPIPTMLIGNHTTAMAKTKNWDIMDLGLQEKASLARKGKWVDGGNIIQQVDQDYNEQNSTQKMLYSNYMMMNSNSNIAYNYNICEQPSQIGNNIGVFSSQNEAQTSSSSSPSLFFTPYGPYFTNPFENHIHFLSSNNSHPLPLQNMKPFPPNFNLKHILHVDNNHGCSDKDGAARST